ncbi:MAG: hypothetical protein J4F36_13260 [Nitrosopumilaceae archaeon]|nr:hypothetical protein [Nitrosopumilaceae archaeon]
MIEYGVDLDINRQKRKPFGLRADRIHRTFPLDDAKPGGILKVLLSKIIYEYIVPNSMYISFKAKPISTDKATTFVQNLGRAIVNEKTLNFNGKRAIVNNNYDEYKIYCDLWLSKAERRSRILQGIQDEKGLKYRLDAKKDAAGTALTGLTDEDKALKVAYNATFYIPVEDELFNDVCPFYPYCVNDNVTLEIKLAEAKDVLLSTDQNATFELSNIHLEWDAIKDNELAQEISSLYSSGCGVHYDRIQFLREENCNKSSSLININIRESLRSLRGVLILFKDMNDQKKYACNREKFFNPYVEKIKITINGKSNQLYTNGITPKDLWYEACKFFQHVPTNMTQGAFYNDKFCIWIDTRSSTDNTLHGNGMRLDGSNSGLTLTIKKAAAGSGDMKMYIFLVIDAVIEFSNNSYKKVCYALDSCSTGDADE